MRSRTRGPALAEGGRCRRCRKGRWSAERIDRRRPSAHRCSAPWAAPAQPCPSPAISHRDGKGRDAEREGKGEGRKERDAGTAGAGSSRGTASQVPPIPTPSSRGDPFPSFLPSLLPRFPFEVGSAAGAPLLSRRRFPSRPRFPLLSPPPAGIPRSRIPGPSQRQGTGGQRPAGPGARPRHPPPLPEPSWVMYFFLQPFSRIPEAGKLGRRGRGAGRGRGSRGGAGDARSRGGPAGTARPAIKM